MRRLTTSNLIEEVRSLLDETNETALDDVRDIIPSLNRGQDFCANILARSYEPPLLKYVELNLSGGENEFEIPESALEERVLKLEVKVNQTYTEIPRVSYRDATNLETPAIAPYPYAYSCIGRTIRIYPRATGSYPLRLWYIRDPDPLVLDQGRITKINQNSNYLIVDSIGDQLTSEVDSLSSYVNVINGVTGEIRGTYQIQSISDNKIIFRSTPTRDTVLGRSVSGSLSSEIQLDDYLCSAEGVCISILKKPVSNYIIQYAASELGAIKFGYESSVQLEIQKSLEEAVKRSWVGRETSLRVKLKNAAWISRYRNPYYFTK